MAKYFKGEVKSGIFILDDKGKYIRSVQNMSDGVYIMSFIKCINGSQRDFQKLYFAILGEWEDMGYTKDELHEMVKDELFPDLFGTITSTTDLTPEQWTILIKELQHFFILKFKN